MTDLLGPLDLAKGGEDPILEERSSRLELQDIKMKQVVFMADGVEFLQIYFFWKKKYVFPIT